MTWIDKIIDAISPKKLECKRYFDQNNKVIDLPSMAANASILEVKAEFSAKLGQIKTDSKVYVPDHISDQLVQLDQNQYNIANAINTLSRHKRDSKIEQYIEILFKMHELVYKGGENSNNNSINSTSKEVNKTINGVNLKKYLDDRHFKSTALPDNLTISPGYVIWPVALLSKTTFIHKAQSQLIKLLTDCGWKLLVVIGDCGKNSKISNQQGFINGIKQIIASQGIAIEENVIARISEYYQQGDNPKDNIIKGVTGNKILESFHNISEGLIWSKFDTLIKKNYDDTKKSEIERRTVLNNIQPLLTWALVATIVKESDLKAIVIAGEDEQEQWDYITNHHTNNNLGVIYIHELKKEDNKTMDQEDLQLRNTQEMRSKLSIGNMAEWLYTHFVELPKFSTNRKPDFCQISGTICDKFQKNCINCLFREGKNFDNTDFDKNKFVEKVYPMSNPAN